MENQKPQKTWGNFLEVLNLVSNNKAPELDSSNHVSKKSAELHNSQSRRILPWLTFTTHHEGSYVLGVEQGQNWGI